ncbi:alpha/beta hydrolase [Streptomyces sp. NPDC049906]|uniref:alpha/beta hydrolase n=1 Tax=Streptomyces sp. NPDC049906 TaxID=3155656 RepID=UPI0034329EB6
MAVALLALVAPAAGPATGSPTRTGAEPPAEPTRSTAAGDGDPVAATAPLTHPPGAPRLPAFTAPPATTAPPTPPPDRHPTATAPTGPEPTAPHLSAPGTARGEGTRTGQAGRRAGEAAAQPDLRRFYDQRPTWGECADLPQNPEGMTCAEVTVPLDYAAPERGTLRLALARIAATTDDPKGSVLLNFGGPGDPGIVNLAGFGRTFNTFTNAYDVVTFDPRGVGRSSPVTCDHAPPPEFTGADPEAFLREAEAHYQRCLRASGPVLPYVGTVNVARDLDVIRAALGDDRLNYLGFSYGTRLGAAYAAEFPHRVGRMVLDGVDTLVEPLVEQGLVTAEGRQTALDDFATWCATRADCPLGDNARDAKRNVALLVERVAEHPITLYDGSRFTVDTLVAALSAALYSRANWPSLSLALASLIEDDDPIPLLATSMPVPVTAVRPPPGARAGTGAAAHPRTTRTGPVAPLVPADNMLVALTAVNCADDPDRLTAADLTPAAYERLLARYTAASPIFGPAQLSQVLLCAGYPPGSDFIRSIHDVPTPKMLLVGTRGDPATPYRWTVETARRLGDSAVVLDNRGEGHGGYTSSKCVRRAVDGFFLEGDLPGGGSGGSCPADAQDAEQAEDAEEAEGADAPGPPAATGTETAIPPRTG